MAKRYGLIVPNKEKGKDLKRPAIFGDDSDSDNSIQRPTGLTSALKKQEKITQKRVLEEDPTVYQYDEIYDEMDQKRKESKRSKKDTDRKPKYINRLLAAADRRKKENERRIERQIQKEREVEGSEFKDKEAFITTAYKKKLEEMKEMELLEQREEYLERIGDVTKQQNLDGFYRHLYEQKVIQPEKDTEPAPLPSKDHNSGEQSPPRKPRTHERKYRAKKHSSSESDEEKEEDTKDVKKEHLPSNLDADSDFSIDSESEDEKVVTNDKSVASTESVKEEIVVEENSVTEPQSVLVEEPVPKKPKIDIWKKRTIGDIYNAAVQRYFERKAVAAY